MIETRRPRIRDWDWCALFMAGMIASGTQHAWISVAAAMVTGAWGMTIALVWLLSEDE